MCVCVEIMWCEYALGKFTTFIYVGDFYLKSLSVRAGPCMYDCTRINVRM